MSETKTLNVHQRLAAAMQEVTYIQKEKKSGMQYTIVSHDAVTAKVRPILLKHGVVYYPEKMTHTQNGNRTEVQLDVRFVNIDDAQDSFSVPSLGYGIDNQDKGPGKAISYAVKYALLKALGLETGDDPDLDQTSVHEPETKETEAAPFEPKRRGRPPKGDKGGNPDKIREALAKAGTAAEMAEVKTRILAIRESLPEDYNKLQEAYLMKREELIAQMKAKGEEANG